MPSPGSENLFSAIKSGKLETVQAAVEAGADVNASRADILPLLFAVREHAVTQQHLPIITYLIEQDASIEAINNFGWNALLEATRAGQMDVVRLMDEYQLNLNVTSQRGDGLIHAAVQGNTTDLVQFYFDRGVNVDRPNKDGVTPVMLAAERRCEASFRDLVRLGADLDQLDNAGNSARTRLTDWTQGHAVVSTQTVDPVAAAQTAATRGRRKKTPLNPPVEVETAVTEPIAPEPVATAAAVRPGLSRIVKRSAVAR
jgi:ankyrin repeat protein